MVGSSTMGLIKVLFFFSWFLKTIKQKMIEKIKMILLLTTLIVYVKVIIKPNNNNKKNAELNCKEISGGR